MTAAELAAFVADVRAQVDAAIAEIETLGWPADVAAMLPRQ